MCMVLYRGKIIKLVKDELNVVNQFMTRVPSSYLLGWTKVDEVLQTIMSFEMKCHKWWSDKRIVSPIWKHMLSLLKCLSYFLYTFAPHLSMKFILQNHNLYIDANTHTHTCIYKSIILSHNLIWAQQASVMRDVTPSGTMCIL